MRYERVGVMEGVERRNAENEQEVTENLLTPHSSLLSTRLWLASIRVTLKPVVNDPPGLAIRDALHNLGYSGVREVRSGKLIQIQLDAADRPAAEEAVHDMCRRLLANPVIEDYTFELQPVTSSQ